VIQSFADAATQDVFDGLESKRARRWAAEIRRSAQRRLLLLNAVTRLEDLRTPPGNRLERLAGAWNGFHSIRVNDQWRIVFRWTPTGPERVEMIDYH